MRKPRTRFSSCISGEGPAQRRLRGGACGLEPVGGVPGPLTAIAQGPTHWRNSVPSLPSFKPRPTGEARAPHCHPDRTRKGGMRGIIAQAAPGARKARHARRETGKEKGRRDFSCSASDAMPDIHPNHRPPGAAFQLRACGRTDTAAPRCGSGLVPRMRLVRGVGGQWALWEAFTDSVLPCERHSGLQFRRQN